MKEIKICVIGLGYVGMPLARLFPTKFETVGFDLNKKHVDDVKGILPRDIIDGRL
jgi:UDP-N-acetyl-D-galactosamine dehydrogenase